MQGIGRRLVLSQRLDRGREFHGNACADDNDGNACQHRTIQRRQMGKLDFLEKINSDRPRMTLTRQKYFDKIGSNAQFMRWCMSLNCVHGNAFIWRRFRPPVRDIVGVKNPLSHAGKGEVLQGPADMSPLVAILEASGQDLIQRGSRHDTQLAQFGNRSGQAPN